MYDNGYIVKCRSILTNDICLSEASHKADVFLVCISYLTYSLKKCIDNLAVWKIRVNLKSASNLNGNLNCSKELEHYAS